METPKTPEDLVRSKITSARHLADERKYHEAYDVLDLMLENRRISPFTLALFRSSYTARTGVKISLGAAQSFYESCDMSWNWLQSGKYVTA